MKPKMKYSTTKISSAKMNNLSGKALVKSPRLRKSQQKAEEVCQMYYMQLRSGLIIKKEAYDFRKEINRRSPKTAGKCKARHLVLGAYPQHLEHLNRSAEGFAFDTPMVRKCTTATDGSSIQECFVSLSTYNDQSITFSFADDGSYEISVEDLGKTQKKGDGVDGQMLMVSLSPTKDKDVLLHANNKEHSVELQKCEKPLPDQIYFLLHREPSSSTYVSFECKSNPGVFIGVKDNHLALIKLGDQNEGSSRENIIFKLS